MKITRYIGLLILLLLAGRLAAQVTVLDSVCQDAVRHYRVYGDAGSTYTWILTPPAGPATILPSDADTVEITWSYPAGLYELGSVQHALNGCDADTVNSLIMIFESPSVDAGPDALTCVGRYYKLINATAADTSSVLWTTSGDGSFDDNTKLVATYTPGAGDIAAGFVTLTLTGFGQGFADACPPSVSSMVLQIVYEIVPTFEPLGPYCQFSIPPALPDTSLEGMTGTWDPPTISTLVLGTFDYIFHPNDPAQCGVDTTIQIEITDQIIPQFDPIPTLCINSTPPPLPLVSNEGITGTWDPPVIDTSVPGTLTYTFNPDDPTQCGVQTTMDITVATEIAPEFDPIGPYCQYETPPALPGTSNNGISGTWQPPVISTDTPGTFEFIFIADPDACGTDTTIQVVILEQQTPEFDPIPTLCQYSAAPILPDTSLNGIHGTWNPAWISTAVPGTFGFTFTPADDECSLPYSMEVTVLEEIVPQFDPMGPYCQFNAAPDLPLISLNGVTGTWSPAVINTDVIGNFFYTFTHDPSFECARDTILIISIIPETEATFIQIDTLCQNSVPPALPDTSLEGFEGTWNPAVINTTFVGTSIYTFTPYDGQCAIMNTMPITVTDEIMPVFDPIPPQCQNTIPPVLPTTDNNGITGTWVPPVINTSVPGDFIFTFTPDDGQCGIEYEMEITVTDQLTPEFDQIDPQCQNSTPPDLPATDNNGMTGTWAPPVINTDTPGTFTFTFTPDPGQCGIQASMDITITTLIIPLFDQIAPLCQGAEAPDLPDVSINGIDGSWDPPNINTDNIGTFTYIFTPDDTEDCSVEVPMDITIYQGTVPAFEPVGPLCQNSPSIILPDVSQENITGSWDPPVINTTVPGTYMYTFTPDEGQCAVPVKMMVDITAPPQVTQTIVVNETSNWQDGSIEIIATGITANLYYSITGGTVWQTDNGLFEDLPAGLYQCIVKDDNGCDTTFTITVGNTILIPLAAISGPGDHCLGDAAIVPIEVDNFIGVASFHLTLSYNKDYLTCIGRTNIDPLLANNFIAEIDQLTGVIVMSWSDNTPVSYNGLKTIVELVFTTLQPGQGQLDWYTNPEDSYFSDQAAHIIPAEFMANDVTIYNPPEILLKETKNVCIGEAVKLIGVATGQYPIVSYEWTLPNGQVQAENPYIASATLADAGDYTLKVTDALGCTDQKSILLIVSENPVAAFHGSDTLTIAEGDVLDAGSGLASYLWNTGETSERIRIWAEGMFRVQMVSDMGCVGVDSVYVLINPDEEIKECLYIPNAFTPNNDGLNDVFKAVTDCPLSLFRMEIFNRWGEFMFSSTDISTGWDGRYKGKLCPGDGYVYKISYRYEGMPETDMDQVKVGMVVIVQ